jgi:hypothetical protein
MLGNAMPHRIEPPDHAKDTTTPAPGELELVRSFVGLHDHDVTGQESLAPSTDTLVWWLKDKGLASPKPTDPELDWALDVLEDLRTKVAENMGATHDERAAARLAKAATETGLRIGFGESRFTVSSRGVRGAVGRLLGIAYVAGIDGSWSHLKECGSPTCRSVFYDRSRNNSGRWCSMDSCGNREKVRRFRERERASTR